MSKFTPSIRLETYQQFFNLGDNTEALYGVYDWARFISSQLFSLIGDFEIIIRSHFHKCLSEIYFQNESDFWFINQEIISELQKDINCITNRVSKSDLNKIRNKVKFSSRFELSDKSKNMVLDCLLEFCKNNKSKNKFPKPDDIIARLSFGFWVNIFEDLKVKGNHTEFVDILEALFPMASFTDSEYFYNSQKDTLYRVRNLRNRISHQENFLRTPESKFPNKNDFIPRNPTHSINSLRKLINSMTAFIENINPTYKAEIDLLESKKLLDLALNYDILKFSESNNKSLSIFILVLMNYFKSEYKINLTIIS